MLRSLAINPASLAATSYPSVVLGDSPVGYWRLNDTTTNAVDSSSTANNGTYSGTYTQSSTDLISGPGNSTSFAGGQMVAPNVSALQLGAGAFSVECFFNLATTTTWLNGGAVCDNSGRAYSVFGYDLSHAYVGAGGNTNAAVPLGVTLAAGSTYHFVVTVTGTTCVVYVNGSGTSSTITHGASNSSTGVTVAGNPSGGGAALAAKVQEFAVYNYVLTSTQVTNHYNARTLSSSASAPAGTAAVTTQAGARASLI